jgi:hypothetical protein
MRLAQLLVEPYPAAAHAIVPPSLLVLDLSSQVLLSVAEPTDESFHVR